MSDFIDYTRSKSRELARALEQVCASPLQFDTEFPLVHSSANHEHLWILEHQADHASWIDTAYRTQFIKHILEHWRIRLKGMAPYRERGYRVYVYEDTSPTLSVVAETDILIDTATPSLSNASKISPPSMPRAVGVNTFNSNLGSFRRIVFCKSSKPTTAPSVNPPPIVSACRPENCGCSSSRWIGATK